MLYQVFKYENSVLYSFNSYGRATRVIIGHIIALNRAKWKQLVDVAAPQTKKKKTEKSVASKKSLLLYRL